MSSRRALEAIPLLMVLTSPVLAQLPPVPAPPENPITEEKRVLGKILFWDAQLSSDSTVACGTCHRPAVNGADPRLGINPGLDGIFGTADDKRASPGVIRSLPNGDYLPDAVFELDVQVTRRAAPPAMLAQYAPHLFWDGRAADEFVDPQSGLVAIRSGGALESQLVNPLFDEGEMAHEDRTWPQLIEKLTAARPLALTTGVPPDAASAIAQHPTYPDLFEHAFGDPSITAARIAFAMATYERMLVPDQTPFDLGLLTPGQQAGLATFLSADAQCSGCHALPFFSDFTFRNIGLRPVDEDRGRQEVTGDPADAGRFKTPALRNVGLKMSFMHNGQLSNLSEVLDFYTGSGEQKQFRENQDPLVPAISIAAEERDDLLDFLRNGLTDQRAANGVFPFDRPILHTELPANPALVGQPSGGSGGIEPQIIAVCPPYLGHGGFKIGVDAALGGASAMVVLSRTPPGPDGTLDAFREEGPMTLIGRGPGEGYATWFWPVPDDPALLGDSLYVQWIIDDPGVEGGEARSAVARLSFYRSDPTQCGCFADLNCDREIDFADVSSVLLHWGLCELCSADVNDDGEVDVEDLIEVILAWGECGD